jgi:hypothetical protein
MGCSRPLVSGGCVLKRGNEMRHTRRVLSGDARANSARTAVVRRAIRGAVANRSPARSVQVGSGEDALKASQPEGLLHVRG